MMRIAYFIGDGSWKGGINYFRNLMCALDTVKDCRIHPVLVTTLAQEETDSLPERLQACEIIHYSPPAGRYPSIANNKFRQWFGLDPHLMWFLKKHHVHMVSHTTGAPTTTLPNICWIPDFQHIKRPDFFTLEEVASRIASHTTLCRKAAGIIVSSHDALNDLAEFCPEGAQRAAVLRFVAPAVTDDNLLTHDEITQKYTLEPLFFHVPNQLWKHKNHTLLIEAISELRSLGSKATIVCTGATEDHRHPGHLDAIMARACELGVEDDFIILGLIPYKDVMSLMRHSVAVINPSFFEGWSSTVEESKSFGKRILLSDIPVHVEQAPARGAHFSPDAPGELAALMLETLNAYDPKEEDTARQKAYGDFLKRQKEYGRAYHDYVMATASRKRCQQGAA